MPTLHCGDYRLDLGRPQVMGVVNVTPDSFSDGGRYLAVSAAVGQAEKLIEEGAALLDIGAESSRPGANPVDLETELARLLPVLHALRDCAVPVSVDTYKPEVMRRALDAGASMINDIWGFRQPGAAAAVAGSGCAVCIMHMQGEPVTMQKQPLYGDVVAEVGAFLAERCALLETEGVAASRILLDPGFGFGKTVEQNYALLRSLDALDRIGKPILVGLSRKSMLAAGKGGEPSDRIGASLAAALAAVARGARIVRVHDVALTVEALRIWEMVENRPSAGAMEERTPNQPTAGSVR